MSARKPIVVVGSINTDLVARAKHIPSVGETITATDFHIHAGGKGANQAVGVARLGYPVRLIGRCGDDAFGQDLRNNLQLAGVDVTGVATSEGPSGIAMVVVAESGDNSILVVPGANSKVTPHDIDANLPILREAGIVLAQLEIPLETVEYLADICFRENIPLILDPAPARELPASIFRNITWFTPNQTEANFYLGKQHDGDVLQTPAAIAETFLAQGVHGVVLKMGASGTYLALRESEGRAVPAFAVNAVDTTAAGDAFNAGFATALMLGRSPEESARFASAVAAISVTRAGAQPSMPSMEEVEQLLQQSR